LEKVRAVSEILRAVLEIPAGISETPAAPDGKITTEEHERLANAKGEGGGNVNVKGGRERENPRASIRPCLLTPDA
jgi:hypothetical protein